MFGAAGDRQQEKVAAVELGRARQPVGVEEGADQSIGDGGAAAIRYRR